MEPLLRTPRAQSTPFYLLLLALVSVVPLVGGGCSGAKSLQSHAPEHEVTIDGSVRDWAGSITSMDSENISVGVLNDSEFLYVMLIANDPAVVRRIMDRGLTLWFDPKGGTEKAFGIRFPLGLQASRGGRASGAPMNSAARQRRWRSSLSEMAILGGDGQQRRISATAIPGLTARAEVNLGSLQYELKVPLQHGSVHSYAVGAAPGSTLGMGMETAGADEERVDTQPSSRTGAGQRTMGRGGRRGGRMQGQRSSRQPGTLKVWSEVALAK